MASPHPRHRLTLRTATGDSKPILGEAELDICIGGHSFRHNVMIADIVDDCILGTDFLKKYGFSINLKDGILVLACLEIPFCGWFPDDRMSVRVATTESIEIPGNSEYLIPGQILERPWACRIAVCGAGSSTPIAQGLLVHPSLVDMGHSHIPVAVANVSDESIRLAKGTEIAVCEPPMWIERPEAKWNYDDGKQSVAKDRVPLHLLGLYDNARVMLDPEQLSEATKLFDEFQDTFSATSGDYGNTSLAQHRIKTGDASPIRQRPRRLPFTQRHEVERLTKEMEQQGVICPSNSPWASPVVLVRKKDGSTRFCVDYRRLNDVTKKDSYPLPRIDDALDELGGSQWFSTIDLKAGYWQVALSPEDREKTAFITSTGLWEFMVMPFGLCNAPATFERLMETVLRGLNRKICLVYLDDVIVLGTDFRSHMSNLHKVLSRFREANLKLNPKKCNFFRKEVEYLGQIISVKGIKTDPKKIEAVVEWPRPNCVQELQSFLGLCSYYRRFVEGFSRIANPLHQLLSKGQTYNWTKKCDDAFQGLKRALVSSPVLAYPQPGYQFILDTDASNAGIGAVLSQVKDGQEYVIAYYSKALTKEERNYCTTRKELLAIVKAVDHFHPYLFGQKFVVRSDHSALQWLMSFQFIEGQLARWNEKLQAYDFDVKFRSGCQHKNADAMSRRPCVKDCRYCSRQEAKMTSQTSVKTVGSPQLGQELNPNVRMLVVDSDGLQESEGTQEGGNNVNVWDQHELKRSQEQDEHLGPILQWKIDGQRPSREEVTPFSPKTKAYWAQWNSLHLRDGVLYRKFESPNGSKFHWQLLVPKSYVPIVLAELHGSPTTGHFGIAKTLGRVRERFHWVGHHEDVRDWCRKCDLCASRKGPRKRIRGKMRLYQAGGPFERVCVDILGPFPRTDRDNRYVVIFIDQFTKWPEAFATSNKEAITVADLLVTQWISRYGVPQELHSDQGRMFESALFQETCKILGLTKTRTTPFHPQSNGMVERFNRTLLENLTHFVTSHQRDWERHLPFLLLAYRSAVHETTKVAPTEALYGRQLRLPCDLVFGRSEVDPGVPISEYAYELRQRRDEVERNVRHKIKVAGENMKTRYDRQAIDVSFRPGQQVWLHNPRRIRGRSPKLQRIWDGPYVVDAQINDVIYRIRQNANVKIVHVNRLAPYQGVCEQ